MKKLVLVVVTVSALANGSVAGATPNNDVMKTLFHTRLIDGKTVSQALCTQFRDRDDVIRLFSEALAKLSLPIFHGKTIYPDTISLSTGECPGGELADMGVTARDFGFMFNVKSGDRYILKINSVGPNDALAEAFKRFKTDFNNIAATLSQKSDPYSGMLAASRDPRVTAGFAKIIDDNVIKIHSELERVDPANYQTVSGRILETFSADLGGPDSQMTLRENGRLTFSFPLVIDLSKDQ